MILYYKCLFVDSDEEVTFSGKVTNNLTLALDLQKVKIVNVISKIFIFF